MIIAWGLRMEVEHVNLQQRTAVLASVRFGPGELDSLDAEGRSVLVMSGIAGQLLAGVPWSARHLNHDLQVLGAPSTSVQDSGLASARMVLEENEEAFHLVREALLDGLAEEVDSVDGAHLRLITQKG